MSDTSIRVSERLADELFDRKRRGESYEDVIWRTIERADMLDAVEEHVSEYAQEHDVNFETALKEVVDRE